MYCTYPFLPLNFSLIKTQRPGRNVERSILKFFMNARSKLILDCKKKKNILLYPKTYKCFYVIYF